MEHANVMGRQELHKLGIVKGVSLTAEDGGHLVGDVQCFPCDQGHSCSKHVLERKNILRSEWAEGTKQDGHTRGAGDRKGAWRAREVCVLHDGTLPQS